MFHTQLKKRRSAFIEERRVYWDHFSTLKYVLDSDTRPCQSTLQLDVVYMLILCFTLYLPCLPTQIKFVELHQVDSELVYLMVR